MPQEVEELIFATQVCKASEKGHLISLLLEVRGGALQSGVLSDQGSRLALQGSVLYLQTSVVTLGR